MSQDASDVYARLLLPKRHGYPLWIPEPNSDLPLEYRETGVRIGDVGIVTPAGGFDFLFNICLPSNDPVNGGYVPAGFQPLEIGSRDTFTVEDMHDPDAPIASLSINTTKLALEASTADNPSIPAGFGGGFHFTASTSEGAILSLPHGASRKDIVNLTRFRDYARENAISWYEYVNGPQVGRRASNGSIYLVTGYDKCRSWGVASFSNASDQRDVSLKFTATGLVEGSGSYGYSWETHSPVAFRAGPKRRGEVLDSVQNQCVFIRGFMISIRDGLYALLHGPVKVSPIVGSSPKTILSKNTSIPYSGGGSTSSALHRHSHGGGSGIMQKRSDSSHIGANVEDDIPEDDVIVTAVPDIPERYHPSRVISKYLRNSRPDAQVVIVHDFDWFTTARKGEATLPDDTELILRVFRKHDLVEDRGSVFLQPLSKFSALISNYYCFGNTLGTGPYTTVKEVVDVKTGTSYACKVIRKKLLRRGLEDIRKEIGRLKKVSALHPNIVTLHDYFESARNVYLCFDLCTGRDFFDQVFAKESHNEVDAANLVRKILGAVDYINYWGFVHQDLKPTNLCFRTADENSDVMIGDFGFSEIIGENMLGVLAGACDSPRYLAPEVISKGEHGPGVDVWAIGVITYVLLTGHAPFEWESPELEKEAIMRGGYTFEPVEYWLNISDAARDFISACLVVNPASRPTAAEALKLEWLAHSKPHFIPDPESPNGDPVDLLPNIQKAYYSTKYGKTPERPVRIAPDYRVAGLLGKLSRYKEESEKDTTEGERILFCHSLEHPSKVSETQAEFARLSLGRIEKSPSPKSNRAGSPRRTNYRRELKELGIAMNPVKAEGTNSPTPATL